MIDEKAKVVSPCVSLCCLDEEDVCMGCLRHVDEITGWHQMDEAQRLALMKELERRRAERDKNQLG